MAAASGAGGREVEKMKLRARFLELQSTFDAEDRRRPREGKENEDARVPSEP